MRLSAWCAGLARRLTLTALYSSFANAAAFDQQVLGSHHVEGTHGAVSSESRECSLIGRDLLAQGGNAVDALVGTVFCVGVIGSYHSGIGGGGFALVRDKEGNVEAIDFRESAPAAAHENMYDGNVKGSVLGGLAVGVPGELRGLDYMHSKYGVSLVRDATPTEIPEIDNNRRYHGALSWLEPLMSPGLASEDLIDKMESAIKIYGYDFVTQDPEWAEDFAPTGVPVKEGQYMTRRRYAATLQRIATEGPDIFYKGDMAHSMIKSIQAANGTMTLDDLASYEVITRNVTTISYRGHTVHGIGSPAGSAVSFSILKTMEQFPTADWSDIPLSVHRFDEAMRFAYGARLELGDPGFVDNVAEMEEEMLTEEKAKEVRSKILDDKTQPVKNYLPHGKEMYQAESHGTSHMATADRSGMATSMTTTVNLLFGSLVVDPVTGIILNNEMNDFSIPGVPNEFNFPPSPANFIRPNKRPLSSCTPMIVTTPSQSSSVNRLFAVLGAGGGSRIISATAQTLWHVVEHNVSMKAAIAEPRLHDQLMPNVSTVEYMFDNETVKEGLTGRGHDVNWVPPIYSAVQGILLSEDGFFEAAGESRQANSGGETL